MDAKKPDYTTGPPPLLRTLILEDNPHDAKLMVALLESGGYKVQSTVLDLPESFREHLEIAEYDVILADFNLRNWTALDALEILKRSGKDIPLIVVTGALGDEAAVECIKQGAADFVLKDRLARLPSAVHRVLEEKRLRTENKRAFEATSRLATIVESSDDAIIGKTLDGVITSWNKGAEKLYGYSAAEVLGQPISVLFPPDRSEELPHILARLKRGERVDHYEAVRVRKDGRLVDVSLSIFSLTDSTGKVTGVSSIARDITEHKRAEEAVRESETAFRTLAEAVPQLVWMCTPNGLNIYFNQRWVNYTGLTLEESYGRGWNTPFHPDDKQPAWDAWNHAVESGDTYSIECRLRRADDTYHWFLTRGLPLRDATGGIVKWFGTCTDIDELKRAEEALRESQALTNAIVESTSDMIWSVDSETFKLLTFNRSLGDYFLQWCGIRLQIGTGPKDHFPTEDLVNRWHELYQRALSEGSYTTDYNVTAGSSVLQLTFNLLKHDGKVFGISVFGKNITERKQAEKALRESEERLKEAEHLAHVGSSSWDVATDTTTWSDELYRIVGRDPQQPAPTHQERAALYAPEDWARLDSAVKRALATGEPYDLELEVVRPDGTRRQTHTQGAAVRGDDGRIVRLHGTLQDITERKRVAEALQASEARFRTLMERAPTAVSISRCGLTLFVNQKYLELYGFQSVDELVGRSIGEQWSPACRAMVEERARQRSLDLPVPERYEAVGQRKDGSQFPVEVAVAMMDLPDGQASVGFLTDITERKGAEEALRDSEERFRSLVENATVGIYRTTPQGNILMANRTMVGMLGYKDLEELATRNLEKEGFEPNYPRRRFRERMEQDGEVRGLEEAWTRRDGSVIFVRESARVVRDESGNVLYYDGIVEDITERKRAEEALRESEEKYRSLVSNIPDVAWTMDAEFRFAFISRNMGRVSGFSPDEVYQQGIHLYLDSLHPDDVHKVRQGLQALFAEGRPFDVECRAKRKDGEWIWIHDRAHATYEKNGIRYADGLLSDITERKRVEEKLRLTQFSVEHASDAIFWMDSQGQIVYVNDAACRSLGRSREELLSLSIPEIDPLVPKEVWGMFWEEVKGRGSMTFETQHQAKQGRVIPVEVTANYFEFDGREYSFAFARDITERKQAEAEHIRLVTAIEQSAEGVVITSTTGDIEYVNPAFSRITGYTREEILGQNPRVLKSGKQEPAFYQQLWATILNGQSWHGELINRRRDGSLYTEEMSIAPVRNPGGEITHFIATKLDVTARKQLEQQFLQAQKMEAVGRLAGGVAHDFNNLLTIINGFAQTLTERISPEDPRRGHLKEILMAGERAASLTRQLLAFSRRQVMEPRVLDLSSVLAEIEKMLRHLIGEDVELVTTLRPGLGRVKVDPGQIEQVIMNLAVNARDAMPEGGKFLIETSNVEVDEDYTRSHPNMIPGKYVMMAVSDTGSGMNLDTQAHIFEPFFTTKEEGRGTGLGLATVYGIVKQSGGFIWVYSEPERGSTFKIYFPQVEEDLPTTESAEIRTLQVNGSETVLVVEDEGGVRSLVCEALISHGYKVLEATGAAQALKLSKQHTEPIHLLLTDVVMPGTNGKQLALRLSSLHPETKVLYMSGYTDDAIVRHGILEGGIPFLQKPFAPNALLVKVREVLEMNSGTQQ